MSIVPSLRPTQFISFETSSMLCRTLGKSVAVDCSRTEILVSLKGSRGDGGKKKVNAGFLYLNARARLLCTNYTL